MDVGGRESRYTSLPCHHELCWWFNWPGMLMHVAQCTSLNDSELDVLTCGLVNRHNFITGIPCVHVAECIPVSLEWAAVQQLYHMVHCLQVRKGVQESACWSACSTHCHSQMPGSMQQVQYSCTYSMPYLLGLQGSSSQAHVRGVSVSNSLPACARSVLS